MLAIHLCDMLKVLFLISLSLLFISFLSPFFSRNGYSETRYDRCHKIVFLDYVLFQLFVTTDDIIRKVNIPIWFFIPPPLPG